MDAVTRLREMHLRYRDEDRGRSSRLRELREAGPPDCPAALQHDAKDDGSCRWCGKPGIERPVPRPPAPYDQHGGIVLVHEAYELYWGNGDDVDLPNWYVTAVNIAA